MAEQSGGSYSNDPFQRGMEVAETVSSIFKRRQWEKEELDFRASAVKQFEKRIMAAGMLAAQSTVDDSPDAPADVPKEIIMASYDLKMAAAMNYPNNPLVAKAADTLYQNGVDSVKTLFEAQKSAADIHNTEATAANTEGLTKYKKAELDAGKPAAEVKGLIAEANYKDRLPEGHGSAGLFLGINPANIRSAKDLFAAEVNYEKLPPNQGGPQPEAMEQEWKRARQQAAAERGSHLTRGEKKDLMGNVEAAVTLDTLAENVPAETATNRARYERGLQHAVQLDPSGRLADEWRTEFSYLLNPGMASRHSGSPGISRPESAAVTLVIGQDKIKNLETTAGLSAPVGTAEQTIKILPKTYDDMMAGDGAVSAALSSTVYDLDKNRGLVEQISRLPQDQRRDAIISTINERGAFEVDALLKIDPAGDPNEIPAPVMRNRQQMMQVVEGASEKYADQILERLGLGEMKVEAPEPKKGKFGGAYVEAIGEELSKLPPVKLIKGAYEDMFGKGMK